MKIYLVRHGESTSLGSDETRLLSDKGKMDIEHLANFILPLKIEVSRALQSHKFRAQQTAKILSSSILIKTEIETRIELDPMANINEIYEELYSHNEDALLVGHMPFMGKLSAKLITGNENKDIVLFKPGSMLCLEKIGNKQCIILWMLNPDLFL